MQFRSVVSAALLFALPGFAHAQVQPAPPLTGLYVGAAVGPNWLQNEHLVNSAGVAVNGSIGSGTGMAGIASVGWAFPFGLRLELEGDLRNNPINSAHDLAFPAIAGGRERKYGAMFNALYDISPWLPNPYVAP
jgi:hypothetical protein